MSLADKGNIISVMTIRTKQRGRIFSLTFFTPYDTHTTTYVVFNEDVYCRGVTKEDKSSECDIDAFYVAAICNNTEGETFQITYLYRINP